MRGYVNYDLPGLANAILTLRATFNGEVSEVTE
jgi:hypothetical protein